jgi:hypothetical protein
MILRSSNKMKLDVDPFPANINMIDFKEKRVLVQTNQVGSTKGKNVIISDEPHFEMSASRREAIAPGIPRAKMIKSKSPKPGVWKENLRYMPKKHGAPHVEHATGKICTTKAVQCVPKAVGGGGGYKRRRSPSIERGHQSRTRTTQ